MTSTKLIALATLLAVTNAAFREGSVYAIPGTTRRDNQVNQRTTTIYGGSLTSITPTQASTTAGDRDVFTSRGEDYPFTTTETASGETRYEDAKNHDDNPSYSYAYDVRDAETGDTKAHSESLENGVVKGRYSVMDPNGVRRTVQYTADAARGFNAVVNMEAFRVITPKPNTNAQQFAEESSGERRGLTTPSPSSTSAAPTTAEDVNGPQKSQPGVYRVSHLVHRPAPVVYRPLAPRVFYTPVVPHQIAHHVPRIAIVTTPLPLAAEPAHNGAIYV